MNHFTEIGSSIAKLMIMVQISLLSVVFSYVLIDLENGWGSNMAQAQSSTVDSQIVKGHHIYAVQAGGGNASISTTQFIPSEIKIRIGDSVKWNNPAEVAIPHTITFIMDPDYQIDDILSEYTVIGTNQFIPIPPESNSEPVLNTTNRGISNITALNTRAFNPTIIDSYRDITYLISNSSYTMNGTEKFLNSGTILPDGITKSLYPQIHDFTVTFMKSGTYEYFCLYHPWMTGRVVVN